MERCFFSYLSPLFFLRTSVYQRVNLDLPPPLYDKIGMPF